MRSSLKIGGTRRWTRRDNLSKMHRVNNGQSLKDIEHQGNMKKLHFTKIIILATVWRINYVPGWKQGSSQEMAVVVIPISV